VNGAEGDALRAGRAGSPAPAIAPRARRDQLPWNLRAYRRDVMV